MPAIQATRKACNSASGSSNELEQLAPIALRLAADDGPIPDCAIPGGISGRERHRRYDYCSSSARICNITFRRVRGRINQAS